MFVRFAKTNSIGKRKKEASILILAFIIIISGVLGPAHDIHAASCVLQGNTITTSCDFAPGTYYYNGTFTVNSGVTVTAGSATTPGQVVIIADDFVIIGTVSADGVGSAGAAGSCPGATGGQGSGGCYGGSGGRSSANAGGVAVYGSATEPASIGSGGGDDTNVGGIQSGAGGGAIKLATYSSSTGTLEFGTSGSITANGASGNSFEGGGGSGGSIWLDVGIMEVQFGSIIANGGNGTTGVASLGGGGGSGGRVALHYGSASGTPIQTRSAYGGNRGSTTNFSAQPGAPGTLFVWDRDEYGGDLTIDNNNQQDTPFTPLVSGDDLFVQDLAVTRNAHLRIGTGTTLTMAPGSTLTSYSAARLQSSLWVQGTFNAPNEAMTISGLDIHQNGTVGVLKYLTFDNGLYGIEPSSALFSAGPGNRLGSLILSGTGTTTYSATGTGMLFTDVFQAKSNVTITHATNTSAHLHSLAISATSSIDVQSGALVSLAGRGFSGGACNNNGSGTAGGARQSGGAHGGDGGAGTGTSSTTSTAYGSLTQPDTIGSGGGGHINCGSGVGGGGAGTVRLSAPTGTVTMNGTVSAAGSNGSGIAGGGGAGGSAWVEASTIAGSGTINVRGGAGSGSTGTNGGGGGGGGRIAITYADGDPDTLTLQANGGAFSGAGGSGGAGTIFLDDTNDASPNGTLILDNNSNTFSAPTSQVDTSREFDFVTIRRGAQYGVPNGKTLKLPSGGAVTSGSSGSRPSISVQTGGTLDANTVSWNVEGLDLETFGTVKGPTSLSFKGAKLKIRGGGRFFAPVTDLDFQTDSGFEQESDDPNLDLTNLSIPAGSTFTRYGGATQFGSNFQNLTIYGTYVETSSQPLFVDTFTVQSGGLITHATNTHTSIQTGRLTISATTSISIHAGGSISTVSKGFQGTCLNGNGPGGSGNGGLSGAHGGNGGVSGGVTYGSATAPITIGSSGSGHNGICSNGFGGNAGGAIKLTTGGTLLVAGSITSAGSGGTAGSGGAGGSIWLDADTITGGGTITAVGGSGSQTGGGGGRIAIYYNTDSATGSRLANGGTGFGSNHGGAGTIFLDDKNDALPNGTLVIDNNNINGGTATTQTTITSQTYDVVDVREAGNYTVPSGHTLALASGGTLVGGGSTRGTLTVNSGGTFNPNSSSFVFDEVNITNSGTISTVTNLDVGGATVTLSGAGTFSSTLTALTLQSSTFTQGSSNPGMSVSSLVMAASTYNNNSTNPGLNLASLNLGSGNTFVNASTAYYPLGLSFTDLTVFGNFTQNATTTLFVDDLVVQSGGLIMHATNTSTTAQDKGFDISATSSISVLAGGSISTAGRGYAGSCFDGNGPGKAGNNGHGAGHGGNGSAGGSGAAYGSATSPVAIGSGGSGFNGFCSNGVGGAGGGAIKLSTDGTLLVAGTISAAAATGTIGGGAGGSILLDVGTLTGGGAITANGSNGTCCSAGGGAGGRIAIYYVNDSATGTRTAYGGASGGTGVGGAGTVFIDDKDDAQPYGTLIVNNNNQSGANTTQVNGLAQTYDAVSIINGASYIVPNAGGLTVASASAFTTGGSTRPTLTIGSGATFDLNTADLNLQNINITNAGTMPDVTTMTLGSGTFTHSGTFSAGLTDLTVRSGGNFVHATTAQLFSGSDLTVENGGTFTQSSSSTLNITTVLVKSGGTITSGDNTTTHAYGVNISSTTFTIEPAGIVTTDAKGFDSTTGDGQGGDGTAGGGAGYGGGGGRGVVSSVAQGTAGVTYGSATSPNQLGSGGGDDTNNSGQQGGAGGGSIILTVTGTFTQNGDLSADGQNGTANEGGGGSGGSIWLTLGGWVGSGTSTITAIGGTGNGNDTTGGGCGGGGRIYITYAGKSYTGGAPSAAAGSGCTGLRAATDGTFLEEQTGGPPTNTGTVINPVNPEVGQNVVFSATATDDDGVAKIELYLDGTAPANLVKTCLFSPVQSPATCQYQAGSLTAGSHSVTTVSYDEFDATDSDTVNFTVAARTGANTVDLSTYKKGAASVFSLSFTLSATSTGTLVVTFPSQFSVNSAATSGSSCLSGFAFDGGAKTLTATKTACVGTVTMTGATLTNPALAGPYTITWTNDNGSAVVTIVDDDNFTISASIDPIITFNVGAQAAASACDGTFAGFGGTLGLGVLLTSSVGSSDVGSVPHICTRLSTNAPGGAVVTVMSQNASLKSVGVPGDTIPSSTATLAAGTTGYGLCAGEGGSDTGRDSTIPVGASPVRTAPFASSCSTSGHAVGALTTSPQTVWSVDDPTQNAFARIFVKAAISSSVLPHDDYQDVLTFIATATY